MAVGQRWIDVRYKCACLPVEASLQLREREVTEDIMGFMGRVQVAIGQDHARRSPLCLATTMEYAKIPAPGDGVGRAEGGTG